MLLHIPVTQMLLHVPLTGLLLHVPSAEVLLHVPISGLLPHVPIVGMLPRSTGAGWPHPSGCSPRLTPGDAGTSVALGGAETMLMGLWPVPRGPQQLLSLTAHQDPPQHSQFQWTMLSGSALQDPPAPHSKSNPFVMGSSSPPRDHSKYGLPSHATRRLFSKQVRKRWRRKGGARPGRAALSRRDAASTCRAVCQLDGGWTVSSSPRQTAVGKGGEFKPKNNGEEGAPSPRAGDGGLNPSHGTCRRGAPRGPICN